MAIFKDLLPNKTKSVFEDAEYNRRIKYPVRNPKLVLPFKEDKLVLVQAAALKGVNPIIAPHLKPHGGPSVYEPGHVVRIAGKAWQVAFRMIDPLGRIRYYLVDPSLKGSLHLYEKNLILMDELHGNYVEVQCSRRYRRAQQGA